VEADNRLGFEAICGEDAVSVRAIFCVARPFSRRPVLDTGLGFSRTFPFGKMPE
jgi:hypothetical protein